MRGIENWGAAVLLVALVGLLVAVALRVAWQVHPAVTITSAVLLAAHTYLYTRKEQAHDYQ